MTETPDTYFSLFAGYSAIWAIVLTYLIILGRKMSRIQQQLASLTTSTGVTSGSQNT